MTKRDYVQFARMIRAERHKIEQARTDKLTIAGSNDLYANGRSHELDSIVESLADIFQADNERFDRDRFIQACQLPEKEKE